MTEKQKQAILAAHKALVRYKVDVDAVLLYVAFPEVFHPNMVKQLQHS